jgi:L-ribulose-5-phosphate 3-epimerase
MSNRINTLGMMSYVYLEHSAASMAAAIEAHGIELIQLDPRQKGLLDDQGEFHENQARALRSLFADHGISIPVLSGYMNLLDPDPDRRERNLKTMEKMISLCPEFGASYIATETGSFHPTNQWADHPDNRTEQAWEALLGVTERLRKKAVEHGVTLLLEGYVNNVLATTEQAAKLVKTLGSEGLGLVMDPFNYMQPADLERQEEALDLMFANIIAHSPIAHAKDVIYTEKGIKTPRVGTGRMRWELFASRLSTEASEIPLFMEHLQPDEAGECIAYIRHAYAAGSGA